MPRDVGLEMDLRRKLEGATTEMKTDKFWRDMAKPIDLGLRCLKDEEEAFDSVSAKEAHTQAIKAFEAAKEELDKAAENRMFISEAALVTAALAQLKGSGEAAELKQQAETAAQTKYVPPADQVIPSGFAKPVSTGAAAPTSTWDEAAARNKPFEWEQDDEDGMVGVRISVPPECGKNDVKVTFGPQHLRVVVAGHPLQPCVIDGDLLYGIKSSESSWAIEGKGSKRTLVLSLEKASPQPRWAAFLADDEGKKRKDLTELVGDVEGLKPYGE